MRYVTNKGEYILTLNYLSAAALFALSSIGYAGSMGPACVNNKANLLCEKAGWDLGLHALYLQSSYGDDLRFIGLNRTGVISTDTANSSRWSWGFQLEGAYHFKNGGDVNLNWSHLDGKRTGFSPSLVYFNGGASGVNTVSVQSKWDALNLEMGKSFGWANSNTIRLHGGVQFASIQTEISEIGTKGFSEGESYSAFPVAKFSGAGPRIGGDFGYGLVNNLTLYFNGAAEVLAGQSRFRNTYTLGSVVQPISHNKTMLVPEVDAKIGLNYTFNASQSTLILDGGYMWVNYFNAQQSDYGNDPDNNFSLQGPYLGIKWIGLSI